MSSMMNGRSGGGFGGGAPVYRSSHQQGTDGPPGSRRPRRSKTQEQRGRNDDRQHSSMCFRADVSIAASDRKRLIGPGGCIIKRLTESTGAHIHIVVPNKNKKKKPERGDDNQVRDDENEGTVYIKAATIASLLHALWRIVELLRVTVDVEDHGIHHHAAVTNIENIIHSTITPRTLDCQIRFLPDATPPVAGKLVMGTGTDPSSSPFLVLENECLSAYCIILVTTSPAEFTTQQLLETLLDNERFAHSEWSANSEIVECTFDSNDENEVSTVLIFIHGTESQYPKQLCQSLARSIRDVFFTSDGHRNRRK